MNGKLVAHLRYVAQLLALLIVAMFVGIMHGCAAVPGSERVPRAIAESVTLYCVAPQPTRALMRAAVNRDLVGSGHSITVNCAADRDIQVVP